MAQFSSSRSHRLTANGIINRSIYHCLISNKDYQREHTHNIYSFFFFFASAIHSLYSALRTKEEYRNQSTASGDSYSLFSSVPIFFAHCNCVTDVSRFKSVETEHKYIFSACKNGLLNCLLIYS